MEEWKSILGTNYCISSNGNVVSNSYNKSGVKKELKKIRQKTGYDHVTLFINGCRNQISVHRLVAKYFVPNPCNKPQVNHKDGNKRNNNCENLEWVTASENRKHAFDTGFQRPGKSNLGKRYGDAHRKSAVILINNDGSEETFSCIREASHTLKISETAISNCLNGRSKTSGGKQWKYA